MAEKRAKRGYRSLTIVLPIRQYEALKKGADGNYRTPEQQAVYYLDRALYDMEPTQKETYNGGVLGVEEAEIENR